MKAIILASALLLSFCVLANGQLPQQQQGNDGVVHLVSNPDKVSNPDVQNQTLRHIGMQEQWNFIRPTKAGLGEVMLVSETLAVAIFPNPPKSYLGFQMIQWSRPVELELHITLVKRNASLVAEEVTKGSIELKKIGAVLDFTVELKPEDTFVYRFTPVLHGKKLDDFFIEFKHDGLRFTKRPKERKP